MYNQLIFLIDFFHHSYSPGKWSIDIYSENFMNVKNAYYSKPYSRIDLLIKQELIIIYKLKKEIKPLSCATLQSTHFEF